MCVNYPLLHESVEVWGCPEFNIQAGKYEATVLPLASITSQDSFPRRGGISDFFPNLMAGIPLTSSVNMAPFLEDRVAV